MDRTPLTERAHRSRCSLDPVRPGQEWRGELGPTATRIDCRIVNVVVLVNASTSAAARTPVYLAMTGAAARSVSSSR